LFSPLLSVTLPPVADTIQKIPRLSVQLGIITLARLFLNTGLRMVYPFAPALARGLDVPLVSIYNLVTIRNFAGFLSPAFGPLSERYGRKPLIAGALLFFSLGCLLVVTWPRYWFLGLALCIIAVAKVIYDPAMQAYLGDTIPYRERGRAIAVTELSWAGALLVGAPAVGFTIQRQGWQSPFIWLGLLGVGAAVLLWRLLPSSSRRTGQTATLGHIGRVWARHPVIWAAALYTMLAMAANETLFIVYGDWMEDSFSLSLTNLGLASGIIGGAEIAGEIFVGWSVDRFGKRPVIITTGLLTALLYAAIPFTSAALTGALITLFILFLFFEITVVGGIPLMTEIVPSARGVVLSTVLAAGALGRATGSLLGPRIWQAGGFVANGLVAAVVMLIAISTLALWVREGSGDWGLEIGD